MLQFAARRARTNFCFRSTLASFNLCVLFNLQLAERGDNSKLHIIIFDEIDAICKERGSTGGGTGVGDSVVNQLLSKIDGVEALTNVLLIGKPYTPGLASLSLR